MDANFDDFFASVRNGDTPAVEELVGRYEPYLRRVIRLRLHNSVLRRVADSVDICQSVLADFFRRALAGEFSLHSPDELQSLLVQMAVNRFLDRLRGERRQGGGLPAGWDAPDRGLTPGRAVDEQDLIDAVRARLSEEDRWLFDQKRVHHRDWAEIAAAVGGSPDGLRVKLSRAVARAWRELGLGGPCDVL
jgi:DNA-directed RNA polymerase specialized sigma24 family protein